MTIDEAHDAYLAEDGKPHFKLFAATVGRFQEGFLRDRVTLDLDEAFARGVDAAVRLLPAIKIKAAVS
jgi:hypothetical protein